MHAKFETRYGYISQADIAHLACEMLEITPEDLELVVGRYTRGKFKGQLRGMLQWQYCYYGGWVSEGHYYDQPIGYVVKPGTCVKYQLVDSWTKDPVRAPKGVQIGPASWGTPPNTDCAHCKYYYTVTPEARMKLYSNMATAYIKAFEEQKQAEAVKYWQAQAAKIIKEG